MVRRKLFNLTAAVSLGLCAATIAAWALSYQVNLVRVAGVANAQVIEGVWAGGFGGWVVGCSAEAAYTTNYPQHGRSFYRAR